MHLRFHVAGVPVSEGSKFPVVICKNGRPTKRAVVVDDNKESLTKWRDAIKAELKTALECTGTSWPVDTKQAIGLELGFVMARPAMHFRRGSNANRLLPSAPPCPTVKPDIDKLERAVSDALAQGGAFHDDSQVCSVMKGKRYAEDGEGPGVHIVVRLIGAPVDASIPADPGKASDG